MERIVNCEINQDRVIFIFSSGKRIELERLALQETFVEIQPYLFLNKIDEAISINHNKGCTTCDYPIYWKPPKGNPRIPHLPDNDIYRSS